jgi:hypothetical protein
MARREPLGNLHSPPKLRGRHLVVQSIFRRYLVVGESSPRFLDATYPSRHVAQGLLSCHRLHCPWYTLWSGKRVGSERTVCGTGE